ncbi:tetratricopeptide repeat protein [Calothrix sp. NIES-2098]|uniref:tetratricopeptide repeat protein n=1 Tax=Calothrix sp. NIES-2098 TaxID=1954171 RepID=UPI000B621123|nr:putative TPR domain protein [Calothrix sp. NIES-2098]
MIEAIGLVMTGFWLFTIYDCIRNEPERQIWLWILLFVNFPGAVIYFLTRWIPRSSVPLPNYFNRWTHKRELWMAEAQAKNIGKAHQYVTLGNLLCDMGSYDKAEVAYNQALEKEPDNLQALWGAAFIAAKNHKFTSAKEYLHTILKIAPDYKYGDASLIYGETLFALQELDKAKIHLEQHIKNWSHPEAYLTLAKILSQQNDTQAARSYLETTIAKIRGSSYYHFKRNRHFISKAEKLLKTL